MHQLKLCVSATFLAAALASAFSLFVFSETSWADDPPSPGTPEEPSLVAAPAPETANCDKYVATTGSDTNRGTKAAPYRTAQKLANSVNPGDVGCFRAGTYSEGDQELSIQRGGTSDTQRVTFQSYPGERATIAARIWVARGANYVTVRDLTLNGQNTLGSSTQFSGLPSPTINADNVSFIGNDVTNNDHSICFILGDPSYGTAANTLVKDNRIHNCGLRPATNHGHGMYINYATDTRIVGNLIYNNADRGIQLYRNADNSVIRGNVIDGNGEGIIFSGDDGQTSDNNQVYNNIISNSRIRYNVEEWWPASPGVNNVLRNNCVYSPNADSSYNQQGGIQPNARGFTATNNRVANPNYQNPTAGDYTVGNATCAALLAQGRQ